MARLHDCLLAGVAAHDRRSEPLLTTPPVSKRARGCYNPAGLAQTGKDMKVMKTMVGVAFVLLLSSGCAPDEKELCSHMISIMENDPEKPRFLEDMDKCLVRMEKVQARHGVNSYRREADCAHGVDTSYKLRACIKKSEKKRSGAKI